MITGIILFLLSPIGFAEFTDIDAELIKLKKNPIEYVNSIPLKRNELGLTVHDKEVSRALKNDFRAKLLSTQASPQSILPMSPIGWNDRPEALVDTLPLIKNLKDLSEKKLSASRLETQPWSDDYWPTYAGGLGARYEDRDFPFSTDWQDNFNYVQENKATDIIKRNDLSDEALDVLSPSEKFDFLFYADQTPLTDVLWEEGKSIYHRNGEVETWFGLCHGWAAASIMESRPLHKVSVKSHSINRDIQFYPADIKALATLLWAKGLRQSKFIGGRCQEKDPERDENGRIKDSDCFDTNPATWHIAITNQIGVAKRSFVLDVQFDYEVWNQPVLGYKYTYFNVKTKERFNTIEEAIMSYD